MLRMIMIGAMAVAAVSAAPIEADAKSKRAKYHRPASERVSVAPQENPDSYDCIRARGQDPAGNYRGYPCWARAALSGSPRR